MLTRRFSSRGLFFLFILMMQFAVVSAAQAGNNLTVIKTNLDLPTVISLGVQVLISDDDNRNATIALRYRKSGTETWYEGLPLMRVNEVAVKNNASRTVPAQFAGSIFELKPDTSYDIALIASDPDGYNNTINLTARTRPIPRLNPATSRAVAVSNVAQLTSALSAAKAGDVITLAAGTYAGNFSLSASGTDENPIVIRGAGIDQTIIDANNCSSCDGFSASGSFIHLERLTIKNANRGVRFTGTGAQGNVMRRVRVTNVVLGVGTIYGNTQNNFYICDNIIEGRVNWPLVYADDGAAHANDDGIRIVGSGHVVCHNKVIGFGDAMKTEIAGARALDFYGNELMGAYDNGLELDLSEGNVRCFRNRFTNAYSPISFQPIYGGPAYAIRNVIVNIVDEQTKLHSLGGLETVGILIANNTFVGAKHALSHQSSSTIHNFQFLNNIFMGPVAPVNNKTVDWWTPVDNYQFDYNGYFPTDKTFGFGFVSQKYSYANFSDMKAAGVLEKNGVALTANTFANGLVGPVDYKVALSPQDVTLAATSPAIDKGKVLPNITDGFKGAAPDVGALELGCPIPIYGPRPEGYDETNEPNGCTGGPAPAPEPPAGNGNNGGSTDGTGNVDNPNDTAGGNNDEKLPATSSNEGSGCYLSAMPARGSLGGIFILMVLSGLTLVLFRRNSRR